MLSTCDHPSSSCPHVSHLGIVRFDGSLLFGVSCPTLGRVQSLGSNSDMFLLESWQLFLCSGTPDHDFHATPFWSTLARLSTLWTWLRFRRLIGVRSRLLLRLWLASIGCLPYLADLSDLYSFGCSCESRRAFLLSTSVTPVGACLLYLPRVLSLPVRVLCLVRGACSF